MCVCVCVLSGDSALSLIVVRFVGGRGGRSVFSPSLAACASFEQNVRTDGGGGGDGGGVKGMRGCRKCDQFTRSFYLTLLLAQESPQVWYVSVC